MTTDQGSITVYDAIARMRKLSCEGKSFSLTHATYNRDQQSSHGVKHCQSAILRPAAKGDDVIHADLKLFYYDQDNRVNRKLLATFDHVFQRTQVYPKLMIHVTGIKKI